MTNRPVAAKSRRRKPTTKAALAAARQAEPAARRAARRRRISAGSAPVSSSTKSSAVPSRNSGTTSFRYHSTRAAVLTRTFETPRNAAAAAAPGAAPSARRARAWRRARRRASTIANTTPPQISVATSETDPSMPSTTPSWAEQGIAEREQHRRDHPLAAALEDPGRQRRHRHAAEAEHHRQRRLAVQAQRAEEPVADDGQPREVAGVLEHAEREEEGRRRSGGSAPGRRSCPSSRGRTRRRGRIDQPYRHGRARRRASRPG